MGRSNTDSESRLRAIIDNAIDGIITIDKSGIIESVNPAAGNIFGYAPEEVIGKNVKILMPEPDAGKHDEYLGNYHRTGNPKIIGIGREVMGKKKDGKVFPFLLGISEVKLEDKIIYTGFIHDISILKKTEEELKETEHRITAIINTAVDGIITINDQGTMEMVNPSAALLFGYAIDDLLGKNFRMLMPEPDKDAQDNYMDNYQSTGIKKIIGISREVTGMKKDGTLFPMHLSISEVELTTRTVYTGFIHDITEQKKSEKDLRESAEKIKKLNVDLEKRVEERTRQLADAIMSLERTNAYLEKNISEVTHVERALRETQRLYSAMASNFPNGTISVLDKELNYVFIDGTELKNANIPLSSLIGTNAPYLFTSDSARDHFHEEMHKVFQGEGVKFEIEFREKFYSIVAVPLNDDKGNINNILVVKQNITEQKKAEGEVLRALEKERELNELKSRFVTMASHEFRTPLSAILSSASLISKYKELIDDHKRDKHIHRIKNSVNNLTGILNDFLSLSKLEEGSVNNNPSNIHLKEFCEEIVEEMQVVVKEGQIVEYRHHGLETNVSLDKQMLKNIIINLLSNAIKYSPENSSVVFTTELSVAGFQIKVSDKGIGISEEDQVHLFTRFFRGHNVTNIQGTGLGLNIVKRYAEMMNGNIEFHSKLNEGTSFLITLPL